MKEFIERVYGLKVRKCIPLGKGFYGEAWQIHADCGMYTAKLDLWPTHSREFRNNLKMLARLNKCGLDFVPLLILGKNGEKAFEYSGGVLAMFQFMDGEPSEDFDTEALFERLGQVYTRCPAHQLPPEQLFTMEQYERVCRLESMLDVEYAEHRAILQLLSDKRAIIEERASMLELFMQRCSGGNYLTVLTHGDAGGNCVINGNEIAIIDWDTAAFSTPERDAWAHMSSQENIRRIEKGLAKGGFEYKLCPDAFGYFANSWFFEYIGNYLQCAVDKVEARNMEMYEGLEEYFGCWIFDVLARADALV